MENINIGGCVWVGVWNSFKVSFDLIGSSKSYTLSHCYNAH